MRRRDFLGVAAGAAALRAAVPDFPTILVHEHIMVDFIGADSIRPGRYHPDEVFAAAKPKLEELKPFRCRRFLECTPNFLGRDTRLMKRLADATGIEIWTNTGLYAAGNHKYLPAFVKSETAEQLARRWIREARQGVDGVKPRFIKIGVNKGPLHEWDRKIVQAAAITSRETGLTVAAHTGDGKAALEELDLMVQGKASPSKFVWVHAQSEKDHAIHEAVAKAGAWVEFDGINERSAAWHRDCLQFLSGRNLLTRALISQDSGWYRVGEPQGGQYNGYTFLFTGFLPMIPQAWWKPLLADNPVQAFGA